MESQFIFFTVLVVFFVGGFVSAIGSGGGLLTVPFLLLIGIPPQAAIATNKFTMIFGMPAAIWTFLKNKKIVWRIAVFIVPFAIVGGFFGTQFLLQIKTITAEKIILFLLPIALVVSFLPRRKFRNFKKVFSKIELYLFAPLLGLSIGIYQGIFGPATGTWTILGLHFFLKFDFIRAIATTKVIVLASGLTSLVVFVLAGKVFWTLALPATITCFLGNFCGSHLAIKKGEKIIRPILVFIILMLLISLVFKIFIK